LISIRPGILRGGGRIAGAVFLLWSVQIWATPCRAQSLDSGEAVLVSDGVEEESLDPSFEAAENLQPTKDLEIDPIGDNDGQPSVDEQGGEPSDAQGETEAPLLEDEMELPEPKPVAVPLDEDGQRYKVTKLIPIYAQDHPDLPPIHNVGVDLVLTETGYIAPREGLVATHIPLSSIDDELPQLPQYWFYASALRKIAEAIVEDLNRQGYIGVFVSPDANEIEEGEDLRDPEETALHLVIQVVTVAQVRTLGSGSRVPIATRINHPLHQAIKKNSPIRPAADGDEPRMDLLRRDLLDNYVFQLNRHPGRRVDVAISRAVEPGGVVLDYLISENPPLLAYFQISNTGTKQTNEWRERFGLSYNQFTGNDDILSIDYVTAAFDESHDLMVSYEAPFFGVNGLRWRVYGSYGQFTATDVGQLQDEFTGDNWSAGVELIATVFQHRDFFVDMIVGVRHEQISVDNTAVNQKGRDDFFFTYIGFNLEKIEEVSSFLGSIFIERNHPSIANTEDSEIINFGRTDPDKQWTVLKWSVSESFYLEPILNPKAWKDVSTPETSTLAHEVVVSFKGQHSFGSRLIPQMEQVAGGFYTVRGYNESATAGDTVFVGSFEYRFHLPRAFKLQPNPSKTPLFNKPFRFAPQQVYARPDWDLILKMFVDAARVEKTDHSANNEINETLFSTGVGVEVQFMRNLNVSVDWGLALEPAGGVKTGHDEFHIVATLLF